jgi:hypothetical protein
MSGKAYRSGLAAVAGVALGQTSPWRRTARLSPCPCRPVTTGYVPRYLRTARTRRWSVSVGGRSSLAKMLDTYFSTAL